ncbi:nucleotidyltransferase substrate binding protein, HI0074 family [Desulfomicrobium apsheronum]|uniref:Nucleotidyltransferase substrate binding protein, HI0074 family n=1 Tax=Desulfomicrobium apsheronum TaxID=52560 RepID=A0A1I3Q6M0_9BACT|nr:nucleotidyltransferase substrate binding protein [Desulfomicrobium apsheronum]SFJ29232.1 nucleotidyltransferase substrate binding protein, HI0074 family [Desulfomicrobium apsheronum]
MNTHDVRWRQRFDQFDKSFALLESAMTIEKMTIIERAGLIQFFEMAFEQSWKLLKDYQEAEGFTITSPRQAIKQAYQSGIIADGHAWINALEDRNLTTHTYNEQTANIVEQKIRNAYFPLLKSLHTVFRDKIGQQP